MKPDGSSSCLFLTPEPPYPTVGGGAMRGAALFEYLRTRYTVDVIVFRENGASVPMPGARNVLILDLPPHSKHPIARAARNFRRFALHRPPLLDRFSGFEHRVSEWLRDRRYRVAVVEHFWCAPYYDVLRPHTERLIVDLHNIESELHWTAARAAGSVTSVLHRRFARAYRELEQNWLPRYDTVLVTSEADGKRTPAERVSVYPNTIPYRAEVPSRPREHAIVFTGNLEYDPNICAMEWFAREIWPLVRHEEPALEWRIVGRNAHAVPRRAAVAPGARVIGAVSDAIGEIGRVKAAVVPLLAGSGTRFKILEAWAAATPVVSTPLGAEGLDAIPGHHLMVAADAEQFAAAVVNVVRNPGTTGANGRSLYLERYTTEAGWVALRSIGI